MFQRRKDEEVEQQDKDGASEFDRKFVKYDILSIIGSVFVLLSSNLISSIMHFYNSIYGSGTVPFGTPMKLPSDTTLFMFSLCVIAGIVSLMIGNLFFRSDVKKLADRFDSSFRIYARAHLIGAIVLALVLIGLLVVAFLFPFQDYFPPPTSAFDNALWNLILFIQITTLLLVPVAALYEAVAAPAISFLARPFYVHGSRVFVPVVLSSVLVSASLMAVEIALFSK